MSEMKYVNLNVLALRDFCREVFGKIGFNSEESNVITDVLLTADLYGIESHGVQRLIRYYNAFKEGSINVNAKPVTVFETGVSAVIDAPFSMGQITAKRAMKLAIEKAEKTGVGIVTVRRSNHFGIAGYYTKMAAECDLLGICMTNTEAIAIPTNGKKAMLGTNPIALCMPADPVDFWFDVATTVVTRGKLEVYGKNGKALPTGWATDENGRDCDDAKRVINNIINKSGGGIYPLGGESELTGSHKGYGLGLIVELFTSVFSGGTTAPHVVKSGNGDTSFCFAAIDYGIFGNKTKIRQNFSELLTELRNSPIAEGCERIYTHGEKEAESCKEKMETGIPVGEKTLGELKRIGDELGVKIDGLF